MDSKSGVVSLKEESESFNICSVKSVNRFFDEFHAFNQFSSRAIFPFLLERFEVGGVDFLVLVFDVKGVEDLGTQFSVDDDL